MQGVRERALGAGASSPAQAPEEQVQGVRGVEPLPAPAREEQIQRSSASERGGHEEAQIEV